MSAVDGSSAPPVIEEYATCMLRQNRGEGVAAPEITGRLMRCGRARCRLPACAASAQQQQQQPRRVCRESSNALVNAWLLVRRVLTYARRECSEYVSRGEGGYAGR